MSASCAIPTRLAKSKTTSSSFDVFGAFFRSLGVFPGRLRFFPDFGLLFCMVATWMTIKMGGQKSETKSRDKKTPKIFKNKMFEVLQVLNTSEFVI